MASIGRNQNIGENLRVALPGMTGAPQTQKQIDAKARQLINQGLKSPTMTGENAEVMANSNDPVQKKTGEALLQKLKQGVGKILDSLKSFSFYGEIKNNYGDAMRNIQAHAEQKGAGAFYFDPGVGNSRPTFQILGRSHPQGPVCNHHIDLSVGQALKLNLALKMARTPDAKAQVMIDHATAIAQKRVDSALVRLAEDQSKSPNSQLRLGDGDARIQNFLNTNQGWIFEAVKEPSDMTPHSLS